MKTTISKYDNPEAGCYIDGSAGSADDCNRRTIGFAEMYGFEPGELPPEDSEDFGQILSETGDDAVSYLNDLEKREGYYWIFEDNSLYLCSESAEPL